MTHLELPNRPVRLTVPRGRTKLPLVEIQHDDVINAGKIRKEGHAREALPTSFGEPASDLWFSPMRLFQAAIKTELAADFSQDAVVKAARAIGSRYETSFVWNRDNFRKADRSYFALADFSERALSGRIAEAVAYLTMNKFGFAYWDRCTTVWNRAASIADVSHAERLRAAKLIKARLRKPRPDREPDFVFEKKDRTVALMESKGSFVNAVEDSPTVKGDLKDALEQLEAWTKMIRPAPKKSYAIGTYIRDESDKNDPSLVAFVDPPGDEDPNFPSAQLPPDLIRRCNYSAWLMGMGFVGPAVALRFQRQRRTEQNVLPVFSFRGRKFAFVFAGHKRFGGTDNINWPMWFFDHLMDVPRRPWHPNELVPRSSLVLGIDTTVLKSLEEAVAKPDGTALLDLDANAGGKSAVSAEADDDDDLFSILPDGSCLGLLDRNALLKAVDAAEEFNL